MLSKGTAVIYSSQVYTVEGITEKTIGKTVKEYYCLKNVYDDRNLVFVPVDNKQLVGKMRSILSREQIFEMIADFPKTESYWIEDDKERNAEFKAILEEGDRRKIGRMVKTLFERKQKLEGEGRHLRVADEAVFARAEKAICEEFALVLNIKKEEVIPFISEQLK